MYSIWPTKQKPQFTYCSFVRESAADQRVIAARCSSHDFPKHIDKRITVFRVSRNDSSGAQRDHFRVGRRIVTILKHEAEPMNLGMPIRYVGMGKDSCSHGHSARHVPLSEARSMPK